MYTILFLIVIFGVFSTMTKNNDNNKPLWLIVIPVAMTIALSCVSCKTTKQSVVKDYETTETHTNNTDVSTDTLSSDTTSFSSDSVVTIFDTTIEKEYVDSTGTKVKEKTTIHNEHHAVNKVTANEHNATTHNTEHNDAADNSKLKEKEKEKVVKKNDSTLPLFLLLIIIVAICVIIQRKS